MADDHDDIDILTDLALRPRSRAELEAEYGRVWTAAELSTEFTVTAIIPPTCVVRRSDGAVGTVLMQPRPPLYFRFRAAPDQP